MAYIGNVQAVPMGGLLGQRFLSIPAYQREYAWEATDHVERLMNDLLEHFDEYGGSTDPAYFLGSMVVWDDKSNGVWHVIDGQQRAATLWILACALRDLAKERARAKRNKNLALIADTILSPLVIDSRLVQGKLKRQCRIEFKHDASNLAVVAIHEGNLDTFTSTDKPSARLVAAYEQCMTELRATVGRKPTDLASFADFLTNRVELVVVEAPLEKLALSVFWTMNARGADLDALDLMKTILMSSAGPSKYQAVDAKFKVIRTTIESAGESAARFLVYAIRATYDVSAKSADWEQSREATIHKWIEHHKAELGIDTSAGAMKFSVELEDMAKTYVRFFKSYEYHLGGRSEALRNFKHLGNAYRQHLVPLLAARNLPDEEFDKIARALENVLFVIKFTGSITRDVESQLVKWAADIRKIPATGSKTSTLTDQFVSGTVGAYLRSKRPAFESAWLQPRLGAVMGRRELRYVFGKIAQYVDLAAHAPAKGTLVSQHSLSHYLDSGKDVEHILPEDYMKNPDWVASFDKPSEIGDYVYRAGNLTLLEGNYNRSIKNMFFPDKQERGYRHSQYFLSKDLAEDLASGVAAFKRASRALGGRPWFDSSKTATYTQAKTKKSVTGKSWTSVEIDDRTQHLLLVALKVWDLA